VPRNLPKSSLNLPKSTLKLPNRHKNLSGQKKPDFIWPFLKNNKRPKELKKGQNLQIWPQKSQPGNPAPMFQRAA